MRCLWGAVMIAKRKPESLRQRIAGRAATAEGDVFVPNDFTDLGNGSQLRRALGALVKEGVLGRLGWGVYVRLETNPLGGLMMTTDFGGAVRQALRKLGVPFQETDTVDDYNACKTTQVQANTVLAIGTRFRRTLSYDGMKAEFERPSRERQAKLK